MFTYSLVQLPMLANAEHDTGLAVATHFVSTKVKEEHSDRVCYRSLFEISPSRIISRYLVYHILLATLAIS